MEGQEGPHPAGREQCERTGFLNKMTNKAEKEAKADPGGGNGQLCRRKKQQKPRS